MCFAIWLTAWPRLSAFFFADDLTGSRRSINSEAAFSDWLVKPCRLLSLRCGNPSTPTANEAAFSSREQSFSTSNT
uniref:Putative secreted protein n=1 Tax=Anopheles darlingi TaxID=43151 RepID=A0A2M4DKH3_ANODA